VGGADTSTDDKYTIPVGVDVGIAIYQLHQDPKVYPQPERYDPDRFTLENCKARHPYAYVPFSAGMRNCIGRPGGHAPDNPSITNTGQKFATQEMKIVLSHLFRNFRFESTQTVEQTDYDLIFITRPRNGVLLRVDKR
jgi:cytochrome P450 family 4